MRRHNAGKHGFLVTLLLFPCHITLHFLGLQFSSPRSLHLGNRIEANRWISHPKVLLKPKNLPKDVL